MVSITAYQAAPRTEKVRPKATPAYVQDMGSMFEKRSAQVASYIMVRFIF